MIMMYSSSFSSYPLSELFQEPVVVLIQQTHIVDFIFQQRDTLQPHAESKSGVHFRVDTAHLEHMGMHHAASQDLDPAGSLTETASLSAAFKAGNIHLGAGLCEREMVRTELGL